MAEKNSIDLDQDPRSIIGSRVFNVPRELVFSAFTRSETSVAVVGPERVHDDNACLRLPGGRRLALCHAWAGRPRLPESDYIR
jgi:uncharacterized protein YndB with AHSA1/START domain